MKKQLCALAIGTLLATSASADYLGLFIGADYLSNSTKVTPVKGSTLDADDSSNFSGYVAFEHFVPLVPNAKIRYSDLDTHEKINGDIKSSLANGVLYYQIFDNDLFQIDLGLAYTQAKIDEESSADLGQAYGALQINVPGTGMYAFGEALGGSLTDDDAMDASGGIGYTFNPDSLVAVSVRGGYRYQSIEIKDIKKETSGLFAGVEAHF